MGLWQVAASRCTSIPMVISLSLSPPPDSKQKSVVSPWPNPHRTEILWCCLRTVWTLPFISTGSICLRCASSVDWASWSLSCGTEKDLPFLGLKCKVRTVFPGFLPSSCSLVYVTHYAEDWGRAPTGGSFPAAAIGTTVAPFSAGATPLWLSVSHPCRSAPYLFSNGHKLLVASWQQEHSTNHSNMFFFFFFQVYSINSTSVGRISQLQADVDRRTMRFFFECENSWIWFFFFFFVRYVPFVLLCIKNLTFMDIISNYFFIAAFSQPKPTALESTAFYLVLAGRPYSAFLLAEVQASRWEGTSTCWRSRARSINRIRVPPPGCHVRSPTSLAALFVDSVVHFYGTVPPAPDLKEARFFYRKQALCLELCATRIRVWMCLSNSRGHYFLACPQRPKQCPCHCVHPNGRCYLVTNIWLLSFALWLQPWPAHLAVLTTTLPCFSFLLVILSNDILNVTFGWK